jgi:hypothetical protein
MAPIWHIVIVGSLCISGSGVLLWRLEESLWWLTLIVPMSVVIGMLGAMRDDD